MAEQDGAGNNLGEFAYTRIREKIVFGRYRPNERLVEGDISAELGISRTPIREALQRLTEEGLVLTRRRGWVVREHSPEEIREVYEVRAALEGFAAALAAERATDGDLEQLHLLYADRVDALLEGPRDELVALNGRFHDTVYRLGGNERLRTLCRVNREFYFNHQLARHYTTEEMRQSVLGHVRIIEALRKRDAAAAEQASREHVLRGLDAVLTKLYPMFGPG